MTVIEATDRRWRYQNDPQLYNLVNVIRQSDCAYSDLYHMIPRWKQQPLIIWAFGPVSFSDYVAAREFIYGGLNDRHQNLGYFLRRR